MVIKVVSKVLAAGLWILGISTNPASSETPEEAIPFAFFDSGQSLGDRFSSGVALGDLDGDGTIDAWVTNYLGPNVVWINGSNERAK